MKILIYGAGVIGSTYGWLLSTAGHEITVLVQPEKRKQIEAEGIHIQCTDFRKKHPSQEMISFHPNVIDSLSVQNDFEYIIVTVNCLHLKDILPTLASSAGNAHILFFLNIWDDFTEIAQYLPQESYFFGFPFMIGGGKNGNYINSAISGLKYSYTPLGELDGKTTERTLKIAKAFDDCGLKPIISPQIKTWLTTHYVVAGGLSAGIINAGSAESFVSNKELIRKTIQAIRDGLQVCSAMRMDYRKEKANKLYALPLFIGVLIARKVYKNQALMLMFNGHTQHAPNEIQHMLRNIIAYGEKYHIDMPHLKEMQK
jgi:Ketopantoate reductase